MDLINNIYFVLLEISRYSACLGVFYYLFFLKKRERAPCVIFSVLVISFLFDFANYFFIRHVYPNSFLLGNTWRMLNHGLMSWFYLLILPGHKNLIKISAALYYVLSAILFLTYYSIWESNSISDTYSHVFLLMFNILAYLELLKETMGKLSKKPSFHFLTAFFIYYSSVLIKNVFDNYLIFDLNITWEEYWPIGYLNVAANSVKNFLLFYGLLLVYSKETGRLMEMEN